MSSFVVTGANGFVGRHLCRHLTSLGHEVRGLRRGPDQALGTVSVEYRDSAALTESFRGGDVLIHCAGRAHILGKDVPDAAARYTAVNVELTMRLVQAAEAAGVHRFVFISTAGVLGRHSGASELTDDSPEKPHDLYSSSKRDAEIRLAQFGLDSRIGITVVRPVLVYGPGAKGNFGRLVRMIRRGWPLPIGGVHGRRSLIGVRNLCDLIAACALRPEGKGMTLVAADREVTTQAVLARDIGFALGRPARVVDVPDGVLSRLLTGVGRRRDYERLTDDFIVRPERARTELGWHQPHDRASELRWALREGEPG